MKTTLKDIADATGVSITAVSKVINGKPIRISDEKRKEILITAREMNYRVNQAARALVTKHSGLIGLIVPDIENPYFSRLAKHLEKRCLAEDSVLLILNSNEQIEGDLRLLDLLAARQVDGIFFCPGFESFEDDQVKGKLKDLRIPLIQVDRGFDDVPFGKVVFDNEKGAYEATNYLLSKGHRKIGMIAPPKTESGDNSRLKGFIRALHEQGIDPDPVKILHGDYGYNSGYKAGRALLQTDATAVFSSNDRMTLGFLKALRETGKTIPEDISLISNDHIPEDYTFGLAITTIIQDVVLLAEESYKAYRELVEKSKETRLVLSPTFIERDSVSVIMKNNG